MSLAAGAGSRTVLHREQSYLAADLDGVLERTRGYWQGPLSGRMLIVGGTGFIGTWLLEVITWARRRLGVDTGAVVVCRHPELFKAKAPHLAAQPSVELVRGDVTGFPAPEGMFGCVVHAAAEAGTRQAGRRPEEMHRAVVDGTRHVLEVADAVSAGRLLYLSSGAVYAAAPAGQALAEEDAEAGDRLDGAHAAYGSAKREAEALCLAAAPGLETVVARGFSFIGPYLPLDAHYAAGNFIADGLRGGPVVVRGDGRAVRSYLYAADMVSWLVALLAGGRPGRAYNVGSEQGVSILELAETTARSFPGPVGVSIEGRPEGASYYVPSTRRAREELGLEVTVSLEEAVRRTIAWYLAGGVA